MERGANENQLVKAHRFRVTKSYAMLGVGVDHQSERIKRSFIAARN